jgi:ParB family chromosome partitioning protein
LVGLPEDKLNFVIKEIEDKNLSVRETEKLIKSLKRGKNEKEESFNEEIVKISSKLKEMGFKTEIGKDYLKIKLKNETDYQKFIKLLENIN